MNEQAKKLYVYITSNPDLAARIEALEPEQANPIIQIRRIVRDGIAGYNMNVEEAGFDDPTIKAVINKIYDGFIDTETECGFNPNYLEVRGTFTPGTFLYNALQQLKQAHYTIMENWNPVLDGEYPYEQSFNELYERVSAWVDYHTKKE